LSSGVVLAETIFTVELQLPLDFDPSHVVQGMVDTWDGYMLIAKSEYQESVEMSQHSTQDIFHHGILEGAARRLRGGGFENNVARRLPCNGNSKWSSCAHGSKIDIPIQRSTAKL
jgi:hypothetical protein